MFATTENQASSDPLTFLGRSILSIRRNQITSMDGTPDPELEDLEFFQKQVLDRFLDLSSSSDTTNDIDIAVAVSDNILSIAWLRNLLDAFVCCEAQFKAIFIMGSDASHITKPPLDRLIPEFLDRTVKALDVCNAITHGIEAILHWQKLAEIAVSVLEQKPLGDAQLRRAKKALNSLITSMNNLDDKDNHVRSTERSWSFGRNKGGTSAAAAIKDSGHFRAWSVAKVWSATKQIQAMSGNLMVPRGGDLNGLALPVYIMSTVMVFVMWFLVAAIPCQDRNGLVTHLPIPKGLAWAGPMISLHERIADDWKKKEKEKKGSIAGLLEELLKLEKCGLALIELADSVQFPVEADKEEEIGVQLGELGETCKKMEEGLVPLQRQIREVFHRMVRSRTEILDILEQVNKASATLL